MTKIFIVVNSGGEYEDRWEKSLKAFFTLENANLFIEQCKANDVVLIEQRAAFEEFEAQWRVEHPQPNHPELMKVPRWPPGMKKEDITPEKRKERNDINEHNQKLADQYQDRYNNWYSCLTAAAEQYHTEYNSTKELQNYINSYRRRDETDYSIDEIELE